MLTSERGRIGGSDDARARAEWGMAGALDDVDARVVWGMPGVLNDDGADASPGWLTALAARAGAMT